jgi:hypothetical protein
MARKKNTTEPTADATDIVVAGPLTAETVNRIVWRACDTFRGVVEPANYKDYILTMLFIKYLTDVRDEKLATYEAEYKGDTARVQRAMSKERFQLPADSDFHYLRANASWMASSATFPSIATCSARQRSAMVGCSTWWMTSAGQSSTFARQRCRDGM